MAKIRKDSNQVQNSETETIPIKVQMFKSAQLTYFLALGFFIISFLFNGLIITSWVEMVEESTSVADGPTLLSILDIVIKSASIILFFLFGFVSLANFQELRGYIVNWKLMVLLVIFSLIQATINGTVLVISAFGIVLILIYFYLIQAKISEEY